MISGALSKRESENKLDLKGSTLKPSVDVPSGKIIRLSPPSIRCCNAPASRVIAVRLRLIKAVCCKVERNPNTAQPETSLFATKELFIMDPRTGISR